MENRYKQLTLIERYQIEALYKNTHSANAIAKKLKRSNKTISTELARCSPYSAERANEIAQNKRRFAEKHSKCNSQVKETIHKLLLESLTPEQISGRMTLENYSAKVCTNTIYRLVKTHNWQNLLARKGKVYRAKEPATAGVKHIPNRVDIDLRPAIVDEKTQIGHWEADTVYGQDGYFVTLVERVTKLLVVRKTKTKSKAEVTRAIKEMMKPFKSICHSITFDNGGEFAGHESIKSYLKCDTFFAKPYHSWQRGLNENTNGLLRRFFPKGMKIGTISKKTIKDIAFLINMRPRKTLNYLSPLEFLTGRRVSVIVEI